MILLDASTKLQLVLAGAITTNALEWTAHYMDQSAHALALATGVSNNATDVDVAAAAAGRMVKSLTVFNKDTASATVTIKTDNGGTERILFKATLATGEALYYEDGRGFFLLDSSGQIKTNTSGTGRFLSTTHVAAGTTALVAPAGATSVFFRMVGAGGGGGGASFSSPNMGFGAGGGGGGYLEKQVAVVAGTSYTCAVGTGGTAGANTGGTGGTGSVDTTLTIGATTYTAKAGVGGVGLAAGTGLIVVAGGAGGAVSTNGDLNAGGDPGANGVRLSGILGGSGGGGSSPFGGGGVGRTTNGAGNAATGFGAGGGGAAAVSASQVGGVGSDGRIVADWYA